MTSNTEIHICLNLNFYKIDTQFFASYSQLFTYFIVIFNNSAPVIQNVLSDGEALDDGGS
jgi:hypothetical protein